MGHKVEVMVHGQYFVGFLSIPSASSSTHWDISPKMSPTLYKLKYAEKNLTENVI